MGKAQPITPEFRIGARKVDPESPLWLVPGRVLIQRERDVEVVKGRSNHIVREERIELNPADARSWSIVEGDPVEVRTADQRLAGAAHLAPTVPPGVVAVTALFGQLAEDLQASEDWNPASRVPGLDICPASLTKVASG